MIRSTLSCLFVVVFSAVCVAAQNYSFAPFVGSTDLGGGSYGVSNSPRIYAQYVAVGPSGDVYFADPSLQTVHKVSSTGVVTTVAGARGQSGRADGVGDAARFNGPRGVAIDATGNIYVTESGNKLLRKIDPAGVVSTLAGRVDGDGIVDGNGSAASFADPTALTMDRRGNLYVLDRYVGGAFHGVVVRKVTSGGAVTTVAAPGGENVSAGSSILDGFALAVDGADNVYFTNWGDHTIRKISPTGELTLFAGARGVAGNADGPGKAATFNRPLGLAFDSAGNLIVVDNGNATLRRIAVDGAVTTFAGQPDANRVLLSDGAGGNARFAYPVAAALDNSGNLFVLDAHGAIVRKGTPVATPVAPILTQTPALEFPYGRSVGARATVRFSAAASSPTPVTAQWLKDDVPISGATNPEFVITSASAADQGNYSVRVSNAGGTYTSRPTPLRVFTPAVETFRSRREVAGGSFLWGITSGAGRLVTVGTSGRILTSDDGSTWTVRESGTNEWLVGVTYANSKYIAVGDRGVILVSSDAVTWTRVPVSGTTQRLNNVAFGAGRFVAVGEAGAIVSSTDAMTWTPHSSGVTTWLRGLVYVPPIPLGSDVSGDSGAGRFYASGQNGVILQGSGAGPWSRIELLAAAADARDIEALAEGPVGIGQDGVLHQQSRYVIYSKFPYTTPDGRYVRTGTAWTNWRRYEVGLAARFRGLANGANALFATGENGIVAAAPGVSGPWSLVPTGTRANLVSGVFHGNSLFVVGENETILQSQPLYRSRLIDISTRGRVGNGADVMISGFVITGSAPKTILLRAAGPALVGFGVGDTLTAPVLTLFDGASRPIATNAGWSNAANAAAIAITAASVGAFPFTSGSADAALLVTLAPGAYTAQVAGTGSAAGVALIEAYDAENVATEGSRAVNISTRGRVGAGAERLIAGFVIGGSASRRVLIRAVGPSLAPFGVTGVLAQPQLELFDAQGFRRAQVGAWPGESNASETEEAARIAGAFPLGDDSRDAAFVTTLMPGNYTVQVSGLNDATGVALVEVYDLP